MRAAQWITAQWPRAPVQEGVGRPQPLRAVMVAALFVLLLTFLGLGWISGLLALIAAASLILWLRPMWGLMALIVFGAVHQFGVLLVFHFAGPGLALRAAQLWKELVVIVLLAKVVHLASRRGKAPSLHLLDLAIMVFMAYSALYLLYPSSVEETTLVSMLFGLRADTFFLLAYFIGRGISLATGQIRALLIAFLALATANAVVAALQFAAPGAANSFFESLSFREYMEFQRGDAAVGYAIRQSEVSGAAVPRAGGLLLSDLALAFYTLLAAPLAASLFFTLGRIHEKIVFNLVLVATMATTAFTVTRSAILAMVAGLGALVLRSGSFRSLAVVAAQGVLIILPLGYSLDITPALLQDIFSPDEASARAHIAAIEASLKTVAEEPFGRGLGTAGQVAQRFTPQGGITSESWYLQIATEIGVFAAMIFALILLGFAVTAFVQYGRVRDPWLKALCLGMGGATIGFGLVGLTLHAWEGLTTSIVFWLFAGMVVRAAGIEAEVGEERGAHRSLA